MVLAIGSHAVAGPDERRDFWLDLLRGEEVSEATLLDDLVEARVIFLGEIHTLDEHHAIQADLLRSLAARAPLALGLEQIEARDQASVDQFNSGDFDFDELASAINWKDQWGNYEQYRPLCETARQLGVPIIGLNAPADVIREIGRHGLADLSPAERRQLPDEIVTDDPTYEKLLNVLLAVHLSRDPEKLRPIFEAQVARDETMAANVVTAMHDGDGRPRTVLVICGAGHINFGLGLPDRVGRRQPGARQRVLLVTESGELVLTPGEQAMAREIHVSHEDLRSLGRPLADYLRVRPRPTKPAGSDDQSTTRKNPSAPPTRSTRTP